ncbi:MAG TPA: hypothetical protein VHD33_07745 [Legionellaceae bacterium]|nr:hypothetical protein [Legionellaceae bacterium]
MTRYTRETVLLYDTTNINDLEKHKKYLEKCNPLYLFRDIKSKAKISSAGCYNWYTSRSSETQFSKLICIVVDEDAMGYINHAVSEIKRYGSTNDQTKYFVLVKQNDKTMISASRDYPTFFVSFETMEGFDKLEQYLHIRACARYKVKANEMISKLEQLKNTTITATSYEQSIVDEIAAHLKIGIAADNPKNYFEQLSSKDYIEKRLEKLRYSSSTLWNQVLNLVTAFLVLTCGAAIIFPDTFANNLMQRGDKLKFFNDFGAHQMATDVVKNLQPTIEALSVKI